jgi:hypothetical protein
MGMKRGFVARAAAVGLLALAGVAVGTGGAKASTAPSCSATGKAATCEASAGYARPVSISATITASPNQEVAVGWDDTCAQGAKSHDEQGGGSGITPMTVTVKLAYAHPDSCFLAVDAGLIAGGNGIHVVINSPAVRAPAVKSASGVCVNDANDSSANGTKIQLWSCNGQGQQDWTYTKDKLVHNGRCLTDPASGEPGDKLVLNACSAAKSDLWGRTASGEYVLTAPGGQLCLTAPAGPKGTQLVAAVCRNAKSQRWSLP